MYMYVYTYTHVYTLRIWITWHLGRAHKVVREQELVQHRSLGIAGEVFEMFHRMNLTWLKRMLH
jgi:hypothetical protein